MAWAEAGRMQRQEEEEVMKVTLAERDIRSRGGGEGSHVGDWKGFRKKRIEFLF